METNHAEWQMPRGSDRFFFRENVTQFLLVEKHRIGGKSLFGGSVACTFFAPTELSVRLIFLPEPNRDANTQHFGSSVAG